MHVSRGIAPRLLLGWLLLMSHADVIASRSEAAEQTLRLHVVFNNLPFKSGLTTSWGFACLIESRNKTVLFDTGGDGRILLANMSQLGLNTAAVDAVVLSHIHLDHTGGLAAFLASNPNVTVYMPASFPMSFQQEVARRGASVETVAGPRRLVNGVHSTGPLADTVQEQAVIVESPAGLIVITGCAHPNVADMVERARKYLDQDIYLLIGGFHLGGKGDEEIRNIIRRLKASGVERIAPSHCTGDAAIHMFREAWEADFVEGGLGAVIEVSDDRS